MYYIQEADKPIFWLKLFDVITVSSDKIILPSAKKQTKLAEKTKKILDMSNCRKVVLSKKVKEYLEYVNCLYSYQIDIADGKWLFEMLTLKALDFIVKCKELKKEEIAISILVNDLTEATLNNIKSIAKQYKRINIVTNHIEKYKKIEKMLFDDYGVMVTIVNNKKKSLTKSQIILNVDFPTDLINKYNIYEEAIILNLKRNVKITRKRFDGLCINDYQIAFPKARKLDMDIVNKYDLVEVYEAEFYKKMPYKNVMEKLEKDGVEIISLSSKYSELK